MPELAARSPIILHPMANTQPPPPLVSPIYTPTITPTTAQSPRQSPFHPNGPPPPGARAPMIRRGSRFDPIETTAEEDTHDELGPRHPLRRIREDLPSERSNSEGNVSLPGIKALLNAAEQPSLVSPFAPSFSPSTHSPLDSPTSRTSRFSSFASSAGDGPGWWAPDERRDSSGGYPSRSGSFSRGPLDDEPDFKRRRSDLAPTLPDADEVARLKWQAQSRNASFPASGSMSAGSGLRSMLYPPLSSSSRGSFSGTLLGSPLSPSVESPLDYSSPRGSPMTGPLARSFAELRASERSPGEGGPSRGRSPVERRPSLFLQRSNDSVPPLRDLQGPPSGPETPQRLSLTRPPSPEPQSNGVRRASLAELIKARSGDDIAMAKGYFTQSSPVAPPEQHGPTWLTRRESDESTHSAASDAPPRDLRNAAVYEGRRDDDEEPIKFDPGMRGMEVLAAESARRVADERNDHDEPAPSPTKPSASGPKYTCTFCAKTFSRPSSLRIHTYSHTGERPFVCKEPSCRRRFSVQSNLKRHAKVHQLPQAQTAQINLRPPPPQRHPMHIGGHPSPPVFGGYPPQGPPGHPHMVHHPRYGGSGFMPPRHPGPGFDPAHGPPPHFHPGGPRPPGADYGRPTPYPGPGMPRRHSHDVDASRAPNHHDEWVSEDEVDELDDDE